MWDRDKIERKSKKMLKEIGGLQHKMLAQNKYSLLIIFQGIDASGKDGRTKGLLKYCNPIGNAVPRHIVPADKNWQKLYFVADVVLKSLEKLDLKWPELVTEKFKNGI